ncbi:GNAT family N-acetyltransferase [Leptobacterium flavescens]|uniref:GNAT family N-acetyltransferase n=1 Tax=Leptobacterium flavescens TaxID=472055 RepID=A0A6P0UIH6_9FLAO|nr:GNAT family N-acetyltransferase [Leptobacterium flavescens]NER12797.1 GNAT family N-acetyltransferase [Leptobacterium flavescens]
MYKVRKARLEDIEILKAFEQGIIEAERPFDETLKDGRISYYDLTVFIKNDDSEIYVVETEDKELVASGYAKILRGKPYLKHEEYAYLGFMFVDENHRGRGVNKLINDALFDWCKEREIYEVRLDVYNDNDPALRAYEKSGFKRHLINMRLSLKDE